MGTSDRTHLSPPELARRWGISADQVEKQKQFADKHTFDYPLVSDPDRKVAEAYGVKRGFGPLPVKRATFVIGKDGKIIHKDTKVNAAEDSKKILEVVGGKS